MISAMTMTLLLPWFPILLATGVGGRLLGRSRGFGLGILCALFWIVLVQASVGMAAWGQGGTVAGIVAGAMAIIAIGGWAGESEADSMTAKEKTEPVAEPALPVDGGRSDGGVESLGELMEQFDDWLAAHRDNGNPWSSFDEFLRAALYRCCKATHVRPFRLSGDGQELLSLSEPELFTDTPRFGSRDGIVGHVLTTGRSFLLGDPSQGVLIDQLAAEWPKPLAWCFVVRRGVERLGVVTVGHLESAPQRNRPLLLATERAVSQFWATVGDGVRSQTAATCDVVSGLHVREAFFRAAEPALRHSYSQDEPAAVAVVAIEGLRTLNDGGRWDVADDVVREVSAELRRKVRMDDWTGRFDGSRFLLLLRRVDSELATLIVSQLAAKLRTICGDAMRWGASMEVRCGLAGSGMEQPDLRTLVTRALAQCAQARAGGESIASDLSICEKTAVGV